MPSSSTQVKYARLATTAIKVVENNTTALNNFSEQTKNNVQILNAMHDSIRNTIATMSQNNLITEQNSKERELYLKQQNDKKDKWLMWMVIIAILLAGGATALQAISVLNKIPPL